jgi:HTH-type transcriptional regulator, competence development regulator
MAVREGGPETPADLGTRLREVRVLRGMSLSAVARGAAISTAYLQKLEAGGVKQPSPKVLHQLAEALELDYAALMWLAGYVVPGAAQGSSRRARNRLIHALGSEELTDEEARELARYLDWYRHRKRSEAT